MADQKHPIPPGFVEVWRHGLRPNQRVMHPRLGPGFVSGSKNPKQWYSNDHHKYLPIDRELRADPWEEYERKIKLGSRR
jgi:hypothetical protein